MTQGSTAVHPKGTPMHNLLYTENIFIFSDLYVSEQYSVPVNLNYVADSGEPANIGSFYTFKERLFWHLNYYNLTQFEIGLNMLSL